MPNPLALRRVILVSASGWTPASLPGLALWLRADVGVWQDSDMTTAVGADGDPVGGWADQSGSGKHATQTTAGNRPLWKTGIFGTSPALLFDGSDDSLVNATFAALSGAAQGTVLLVTREANAVGGNVAFSTQNSALQMENYDNCRTYDVTSTAYGIGSPVTTDPAVWTARFDGTGAGNAGRLKAWQNGVPETLNYDSTTIPGAFAASTGYRVGALFADSSVPWEGYVAEVIVYSRALSPVERGRAERYLIARYTAGGGDGSWDFSNADDSLQLLTAGF